MLSLHCLTGFYIAVLLLSCCYIVVLLLSQYYVAICCVVAAEHTVEAYENRKIQKAEYSNCQTGAQIVFV
jgi:hypothetical protein